MKRTSLALVGYANVGKSVIFNYLTGLRQHVGNWSGKTVIRAEGNLHYAGESLNILDLPGIISLSAYSEEEIIAREYIIYEKPDILVNILDATSLETNLILTIQLLELGRPMILALNMEDILHRKGLKIDYRLLSRILGIPVRSIIATKGIGITEMLDAALKVKNFPEPPILPMGREVETEISCIMEKLSTLTLAYPLRFTAIKLLEKDPDICQLVNKELPQLESSLTESRMRLETLHGHDAALVIADERVALAHRLSEKVLQRHHFVTNPWKKLEALTTHRTWGYFIMLGIFLSLFGGTFILGGWVSSYFGKGLSYLSLFYETYLPQSWWSALLWSGVESGYSLLQVALPYVLPFYWFLYCLEDSGYFARVAFLMDPIMHLSGVHGKACIPLVLGLGCNVPACLGCRIMETYRERFLTGILVSFIPCGAVSVVMGGIAVKYLGWVPTTVLYGLLVMVIVAVGYVARKVIPGEATELIMKMPEYRRINFKTVTLQTWMRLKEFIFLAAPVIIVLGMFLGSVKLIGVNRWISGVTSIYLGLPVNLGVLLFLALLRKELMLVMLGSLLGTSLLNQVLSGEQLFVLAAVMLFYPPCIASIVALWHEFGAKRTLGIVGIKLLITLLMGGIARLIWPWIACYAK